MIKKLLFLIIALIPFQLFAYDCWVDGIYYDLNSTTKTASVTNKTGDIYFGGHYSGVISIPEEIEYNGVKYSVTSIGSYAFTKCRGLISITIPNSVTEIGSSAFDGCSTLTSVTIPNSVTSIGSRAFEFCSGLTSVTIPNSVSEIGDKAFDGCTSIKEVKIEDGESVLKMGYSTYTRGLFGSCPLEKVYIGRNLSYRTDSGYSPFYNQNNLTEVTIGNSVTQISKYAFSGCSSLTSVTIPNSVTEIGSSAFRYCSGLTNITIPNSVTSIGYSAFEGCSSLTSVTIPNSVTSIGYSAFEGCTELTSITIPNSVTSIGSSAFEGCTGLTSITIPDSVISIGSYAFSGCSSLTSVTIPNSVTSIGSKAFEGCTGLGKIEINDLKSWCNISFESQNANPLYYVHHLYLGDTEITELIIPNTVTSIRYYAFEGCSGLASVTIPNSVTSIGNYAFRDCSGLTRVTIGNSVTSIGSSAFDGCSSLKTIFYTPSDYTASFYNSSFKGIYSQASICCYSPEKTLELVYNTNWSRFDKIFYVKEDKKYVPTLWNMALEVKNVEYSDDYGCLSELGKEINLKCKSDDTLITWLGKNITPELTSDKGFTVIPNESWKLNNIKKDGYIYEFSRTITLTQAGELFNELGLQDIQKIEHLKIIGDINGTDIMTINRITELKFLDLSEAKIVEGGQTYRDNLKTADGVIGSYFFYNCNNLVELILPNSAHEIDDKALYNQTQLKYVSFRNSVLSIGESAFQGCSSLTSITIPNSVVTIQSHAFDGCSSIKEIKIEDGVNGLSLGWGFSFSSCPLQKVYIGRNLDRLFGDLSNQKNLSEVIIGNSVTEIISFMFEGCTSLTNVTIGNAVTVIEESAFVGCSSLKSITIPNSVTSIGKSAFQGCSSLTNITIGNSVTTIGNYSFRGCSGVTRVTIGNSVSSIGESAFQGCSGLKKVEINDLKSWCNISFRDDSSNPLYYAHHLFLGDTEITELTIPNSVTSIGYYAFYGCSGLTSITIPNSVTSIYRSAFEDCSSIKEVKIEDGKSILDLGYNSSSSGLFGSCPLEKVYIGRDLAYYTGSSYGYSPFAHQRRLNEVIIGNSVMEIGDNAFRGCSSLTSLTIGNNVGSILNCAFEGCSSLTSVTIPNSVTKIGRYAFSQCTQIKEVILGTHLKEIGSYGFAYCPNISKIYSLNPTPPEIDTSVFADVDKESCQLVVTKGNLVYYWLDPVWKEFLNMNDNLFYLNPLPTVKYGADPVDLSKYAPEGYSFKYETSNSDVAKIDGSILTIVGAGQATIGASYDETGSQMEIVGQMRQFNVGKTDLEIGVENIIINKGEEIPEFELTAKGLVYNETLEDIGELPVASTDATSSSEPGRYTIYLTGGESRNYNLELIPGTLTIIYKDEADVEEIIEDLFPEEETNLIKIFNLEGILIYDGPETEMSLSNLNKGIYVIVKGNTSKKIMIK